MRGALARVLLPSALERFDDPLAAKSRAETRMGISLVAIAIDIGLVLGLRVPAIRQDVLRGFGVVNISLLALSMALAWIVRRRGGVGARPFEIASGVIEAITTMVFVQLTGSVSSYFLLAPPVLVLLTRIGGSYGAAITCGVTVVAAHAAIVALEIAGLVPVSPLFVEPIAGAYALPAYKIAVVVSTTSFVLISFAVGNWSIRRLVEQDHALEDARKDLALVRAEAKPGRWSGATIGAYAVGELLGRGGAGEVYAAKGPRGEVALKVLSRRDDLDTVLCEISIVRGVASSRVPAILDSGRTDDGLCYIAMERLFGEDLAARLRRTARLSHDEVVQLGEQIAEALASAHAAGVVHRDVKPQNVFLVGEGIDARLLDFGIAALEVDGPLRGTPGYLAPEQVAKGYGELGPHTDVFGLAAVLYLALTGVSAFPSRHPQAAIHEALHHAPAPPSTLRDDLGPDVDAVFALAFAKSPSERYRTPGELAFDLRAALTASLSSDAKRRAARIEPFGDNTVTLTVA